MLLKLLRNTPKINKNRKIKVEFIFFINYQPANQPANQPAPKKAEKEENSNANNKLAKIYGFKKKKRRKRSRENKAVLRERPLST